MFGSFGSFYRFLGTYFQSLVGCRPLKALLPQQIKIKRFVTPWTDKPFDLDLLRKKSLERAATDEGLKISAEEAVKAAERAEHTVVSIDLEDMRGKREESKLMREKVGAHYRKYREEQ